MAPKLSPPMTNWPNSTIAPTYGSKAGGGRWKHPPPLFRLPPNKNTPLLMRDGDEPPVLGPDHKHVLRAAMVGGAVADRASERLHILEAVQRRLVGGARDGAVDGFESSHRDLCLHVAPA